MMDGTPQLEFWSGLRTAWKGGSKMPILHRDTEKQYGKSLRARERSGAPCRATAMLLLVLVKQHRRPSLGLLLSERARFWISSTFIES